MKHRQEATKREDALWIFCSKCHIWRFEYKKIAVCTKTSLTHSGFYDNINCFYIVAILGGIILQRNRSITDPKPNGKRESDWF